MNSLVIEDALMCVGRTIVQLIEIGGSIGGPIIRNRLFYFASYSPRFESTTRDYVFADEPGRMDRDITRQQLFGKVTYTRPGLSINGSGLWTPTKADGTLPAFDGAVPGGLNTSKTSQLANIGRGYDINQVNATGSADITLGSNASSEMGLLYAANGGFVINSSMVIQGALIAGGTGANGGVKITTQGGGFGVRYQAASVTGRQDDFPVPPATTTIASFSTRQTGRTNWVQLQ